MIVVLGMLFLIFSNVDGQFAEKKLIWRIYTMKKALPTSHRVEIIDRKKFAKAALDGNIEAFVVYISSLGSRMTIHPARKAQVALLLAEEITVPTEYLDFADVFLKKSANVFPERTGANKHVIELKEGKESPYRPIYSLAPVELEVFKTYIKTNLLNGFIQVSKSPAGVLILFVRKLNGRLRLCVD